VTIPRRGKGWIESRATLQEFSRRNDNSSPERKTPDESENSIRKPTKVICLKQV